jgi:hypothetical protein
MTFHYPLTDPLIQNNFKHGAKVTADLIALYNRPGIHFLCNLCQFVPVLILGRIVDNLNFARPNVPFGMGGLSILKKNTPKRYEGR